jgi:3-oxoacyl-(acyl-carrier-protein) synthase
LIETEESARKAGRKIWSELKGYANTNDAYHQTASSPEGDGAFDAMNQALQKAGLHMSDMDYVNAHGTGTANNDLAESRALQRLFEEDKIPFSSTKAYTLGSGLEFLRTYFDLIFWNFFFVKSVICLVYSFVISLAILTAFL